MWLDHTGHTTGRQYGSSTKGWRFASVGIMEAVPEKGRSDHSVEFTLSFEPPGKRRRSTPDNWHDFETATISLVNDQWSSTAAAAKGVIKRKDVPDWARGFHACLIDAIAAAPTGFSGKRGTVTKEAWKRECVRRGLIEAESQEDSSKDRGAGCVADVVEKLGGVVSDLFNES